MSVEIGDALEAQAAALESQAVVLRAMAKSMRATAPAVNSHQPSALFKTSVRMPKRVRWPCGMGGGRSYRDELAAAHARIAQLEEERGHAGSARTTEIAALERERAGLVTTHEPQDVWRKLVWFFIAFWATAVAFLIDGDYIFGSLAVAGPFLIGKIWQRVLMGDAERAARQLVLVDARIAELRAAESARPT
jgi:hypothetical protein